MVPSGCISCKNHFRCRPNRLRPLFLDRFIFDNHQRPFKTRADSLIFLEENLCLCCKDRIETRSAEQGRYEAPEFIKEMVIQHLQPQGPHGRDAADFAGAIADNEYDLARTLFYQRFIIERAVLAPHVFYSLAGVIFVFFPKTLKTKLLQISNFPSKVISKRLPYPFLPKKNEVI